MDRINRIVQVKNNERLWTEQGGSGSPVLVLLHGLGACGSVWEGMIPIIASCWPGKWISPDLRGHGRSFHKGPYAYSVFAADVASILKQDDEIVILGHSMGGAIGMALAAGFFGVKVKKLAAFGLKLRFQPHEKAKLRELGSAPVRWFESKEEALDRYLKIAGLKGLVNPRSRVARHGILEQNGKFRVVTDPRANLAAGSLLDPLIETIQVPFRLAAGSKDPMVTMEQMLHYDRDAILIPNLGHNMHVEAPDVVWAHLEHFLTSST